jgi:hypothetical protein
MGKLMMFAAGSIAGYFAVLKIIAYKQAKKDKE